MTPSETPPRPGLGHFGPDDAVRIGALLFLAVALFLYAAALSAQWDDAEAFGRRDFAFFVHAGERLNAGEDPYSADERGFVHPPFTLPLMSVLGHLGLRGSYLWLALFGALGWAAGCVLASRLGIATTVRRNTVALAISTMPVAFVALHLGQLSGILFAVLAGTLLLWARGRDGAAGALATLLLVKPNLAVALIAAAIVLGRKRFLAALAAGAALLFLITLPYGTGIWSDFFAALGRHAARHDGLTEHYWQQLTVYGFLRAVSYPIDPAGLAARLLTGLVWIGGGGVIFVALRRQRARLHEPALAARLAAVLVLTTTGLNGYLYYYDAAFLALPTAVLVLARGSWRRPELFRLALSCAALVWLLSLQLIFVQSSPPLLGLVVAIWLGLELLDLWPPYLVADRATEPRADVRPAPA